MLALTGQAPSVQVAVAIATPEEKAERARIHASLDAITARLAAIPVVEDSGANQLEAPAP